MLPARLTRRLPRQSQKLHPNEELFEVVIHLLSKYWLLHQIVYSYKAHVF